MIRTLRRDIARYNKEDDMVCLFFEIERHAIHSTYLMQNIRSSSASWDELFEWKEGKWLQEIWLLLLLLLLLLLYFIIFIFIFIFLEEH